MVFNWPRQLMHQTTANQPFTNASNWLATKVLNDSFRHPQS